MILDVFSRKIRKAFSDSAVQYEVLAGLQTEIGKELIEKIGEKDNVRSVLDVGMGTGRLANRMNLIFPDARIVGMDIAEGMTVTAAEKYPYLNFVQGDARALPFKEGCFDVIFSNLVYQWVNRLPESFRGLSRILRPGGQVCLTMFGYHTLEEFFESVREALPDHLSLRRLPEEAEIISAFEQAGFVIEHHQRETIKTHYSDIFDLVRWLKGIGANRLNQNIFIGRDRLRKAGEYYRRHFSDDWGLAATFEVITVRAKKPQGI